MAMVLKLLSWIEGKAGPMELAMEARMDLKYFLLE
jgi:hypothetical protein